MNKRILQKLLDELNKPSPSIDYLKGMVETLLNMEEGPAISTISGGFTTATPGADGGFIVTTATNAKRTETITDEEKEIPEFLKPGPKGGIS